MSPGSGSGGGCRWARGWESLPARPGPEPGTPPVSSHQVPGITGALSGLGVPAAPLEGEDHVPAPVRVEHRVPGGMWMLRNSAGQPGVSTLTRSESTW